jgi:hypothetical protein
MEPEVADAARMPVGEPRNRRRDWRNLAPVRRQKKQQKWTQSKDGCRRNLVAARRGTTRRAQVARCNILLTKETRGYCGSQKRVIIVYRKMSRHATVAWRKRYIRSKVERATQRVGRFRKNLESRQESSKEHNHVGLSIEQGRRKKSDQGQSCNRNPEITNTQEEPMDTPGRQNWTRGPKRRILRCVMEYQMLDIVEGSPSETKKGAGNGTRAGNVGAPTTLDSFTPQLEQQTHRKSFMTDHLYGLLPIRVPLRTSAPKKGQ